MFRHFQVSEYTVARGYLHTVVTGCLSHQDFGHMAPNLLAYFLFGRLIEGKFGSRKMFYLVLVSNVASILTIAITEKFFSDSVGLIVPKCNGSVPAAALAAATIVKAPMVYFNPFKLQKSFRNEMFMMPMFVPALLYFMLEYYESQIGYVEYLCKLYIARSSHVAAGLAGVLFSLRYLR